MAPRLAGIKHLNCLEQGLARAEWHDPEIAEGLMCDNAGWAVCGAMSNLLVVKLSVREEEVIREASFVDDLGADSLDATPVCHFH